MAKIKESTLARNPSTGEVEFLEKGSTAPGWAAKVITNPAVLDQTRRTSAATEEPDKGAEDKTGDEKK